MNVRQYFLTARGWKPVAISVAIVVVAVTLIMMAQRASAIPAPPLNGHQFAKKFVKGKYGFAPADIGYSKQFKKSYIHLYRKQMAKHGVTGRTDITDSYIWQQQHANDTCAGDVGDTFDSVACTMNPAAVYNVWNLVSSPYWTKRGDLQNTWTLRVLWCGGVGVATFFTGGTAAAAVGPGATACFGSFFIG